MERIEGNIIKQIDNTLHANPNEKKEENNKQFFFSSSFFQMNLCVMGKSIDLLNLYQLIAHRKVKTPSKLLNFYVVLQIKNWFLSISCLGGNKSQVWTRFPFSLWIWWRYGINIGLGTLERGVLKCMFIQLYKCHDISFLFISFHGAVDAASLHCYYTEKQKKTKPIIRFLSPCMGNDGFNNNNK